MITAHRRGVCVVAVFTRDVAETKATRATDAGQRQGLSAAVHHRARKARCSRSPDGAKRNPGFATASPELVPKRSRRQPVHRARIRADHAWRPTSVGSRPSHRAIRAVDWHAMVHDRLQCRPRRDILLSQSRWHDRKSSALIDHVALLRTAFRKTQSERPFVTDAIVILRGPLTRNFDFAAPATLIFADQVAPGSRRSFTR